MDRDDKLQHLAEINGCSQLELIEDATYDSVAQGICKNNGCDYTTEVEPDCDSGWCEECGTNSVASCLVLAGIL